MSRLSSKREFTCKNDHRLTVKSEVIYCPECTNPMRQLGDRFFDHLKIVDLHETENSEKGLFGDKQYFTFNLSIGGIIVNGVTYNLTKRSLMMPKGFPGKKRVVTVYGNVAERIRRMVEDELKGSQSDRTASTASQ